MQKRKKVQVWLSPMEFGILSDYCERNGVSFYSVLKEGMNRVVLGESSAGAFQEESPIAPKQDSDLVAPSSKTVEVASPKLEERVVRLERDFENMKDHERLWQDMGELKAAVSRHDEKFSGLEAKIDEKMVNLFRETIRRFGGKVDDVFV